MNDIEVGFASPRYHSEILDLLSTCGLPFKDITASHLQHYFMILDDGQLGGVIGLELIADRGLVRSLAVSPAYRRKGFASRLLAEVEIYALSQNVEDLYLLTTTAESFFSKFGYQVIDRSAAPECIAATTEFRDLCPVTAVCMMKHMQT